MSASAAERALEGWRRADLWVAAGAIYSILFRVTAPGVTGAMAASAILAGVFLLRRAPIVTASVIATVALCIAFVPKVLTAIVVERVSEQYDLTIDHRLKPNRKHINSDGIRFQGEAHDVKEEEFVILFLGDSFTFGTRLINRRTYPRAFQAFVSQRECTAPVRSVNFGWPSASPLLSLRLLRQIGYKYKPDLVVYSLDVTDFHDDLRYEQALRSAGDYEVDSSQLLRQFIDRKLPWLNVDLADVTGLSGLLRPRRPRNADSSGDELELPADRFFVTKYPLDETRAWIERGVDPRFRDRHARGSDGARHLSPRLPVLRSRGAEELGGTSLRNARTVRPRTLPILRRSDGPAAVSRREPAAGVRDLAYVPALFRGRPPLEPERRASGGGDRSSGDPRARSRSLREPLTRAPTASRRRFRRRRRSSLRVEERCRFEEHSTRSGNEQHPTERLATLDVGVRFRCRGEGVAAVDFDAEPCIGHGLEVVLDHGMHATGVEDELRPEKDARQGLVGRAENRNVGRERVPARSADADDAPSVGRGEIASRGHEVRLGVIDAVVEPELLEARELLVAGSRREDGGSGLLGELDGGHPHTARAGVHEYALPLL
jgi:hypothetical protein